MNRFLLPLLCTTILLTGCNGCSFIQEQLGVDKPHYNPPKQEQESTGTQEEAMPSNPHHS